MNQKHVNSLFHSVKTPGFGIGDQRPSPAAPFNNPGPGQYRLPTDFGYVDVTPRKDYSHTQMNTRRSTSPDLNIQDSIMSSDNKETRLTLTGPVKAKRSTSRNLKNKVSKIYY